MLTQVLRVLLIVIGWNILATPKVARTQETSRPSNAPDTTTDLAPFVYENLVTRHWFADDGKGRREFTAEIRVQTEAALPQLGQLIFEYSADLERLDVEYVRVRKIGGEVVNVPAEAMLDRSSRVALEAPVYTDLREMHVTVPGLGVGDVLEYRAILQQQESLAGNHFWAEHAFSKHVPITHELLEIDIPAHRPVRIHDESETGPQVLERKGRRVYRWERRDVAPFTVEQASRLGNALEPEIQLTTFDSWDEVGRWYEALQSDRTIPTPDMKAKAVELTSGSTDVPAMIESLYAYVATQFRYVSLSFGIGRFQPHTASDVFANGYGDCKDKHTLFAALLTAVGLEAYPALVSSWRTLVTDIPSPAQFDHLVTVIPVGDEVYWLDTTTEVAPFRYMAATFRGKKALVVRSANDVELIEIPDKLPYPTGRTFELNGAVSHIGTLTGRVQQGFRDDAELELRWMMRRAAQPERESIVRLLAARQGLLGEVRAVSVGEPADTREPFRIRYELSAPAFIDWTSAEQMIALPVPAPEFPIPSDDADSLDIGVPRVVKVVGRVQLPLGFAVQAPVPVSIVRDYAEYHSEYRVVGDVISVERSEEYKSHIVTGGQLQDYAAFLRAVAADQDQSFTLRRNATVIPNVSGIDDVEELHAAGLAALVSEQYEAAIEVFRRVVELDPNHLFGWNNLGRAFLKTRRIDEALHAFRKQITINAFDEHAYNNLGLALERRDSISAAMDAFRKQLEINPLDPYANKNLGRLYHTRGEDQEAVEFLKRAVSIDPNDPLYQAFLAWSYLRMELHEQALGAINEAIRLDSTNVEYRYTSTQALIALLRYGEALKRARDLVRRDSTNIRFQATLGMAAFYADRKDEARQAYSKVAERNSRFIGLDPDHRMIWNTLVRRE